MDELLDAINEIRKENPRSVIITRGFMVGVITGEWLDRIKEVRENESKNYVNSPRR